uniref:DUF3782 domain-containing protein n=1 Tax=Candidatus Kentrum eta TaxID=2126337 RepID=A0A450UJ50_9GAMM|nr:MAG: hypothetical protein BECKH772A_GA0070896_100459 [Candidatus Kentron sp. H]VFJ93473.1 MAG: hypothetical protein BECKH772B_GA0070898_1004510 [Candidatus Kentron sp. H]VFK00255.1 MAG: hypothetical protein BECKH772C_GA0070978_1004210 [Candidatus Kentron sp. H]
MGAITFEDVLTLFKEQSREAGRRSEELDRRFKETREMMKETREMMKEQSREAKRRSEEADRRSEETARRFRELERITKEQGRQIGGLGDKFGYFTEGMALPSMERILTEQFGMTTVMPRVRTRKNGEEIELDVLAYANDEINLAMVVEVKSRVKREAVEQLRKIMERFRELYPEHKDKSLMAILAGVDWDRGVEEDARETGFMTAAIHDEIFELTAPAGFQARRW